MGRPKQYATFAERQAAYRQRVREETVVIDRARLDRLRAQLDGLQLAIAQAKRAGDPCARQVGHASVETTLAALTAWFHTQAAVPPHET